MKNDGSDPTPVRPAPSTVRWLASVSVAYGLGALGVVLVARLLMASGWLPAGRVPALVFALVAGYPLALAAGWWRSARGREASGGGGAGASAPRGRSVLAGLFGVAGVLLAALIGLRPPTADVSRPVAVATDARPHVVVLPLIDLDRRGDRYFADGLTDELAAGIAAVGELEVRGRASVESFTDVNRDAAALGERFGGAVVLDGTFRRIGTRLRLSVRLLDTDTGEPLWSMSRDTTLAALFALRDRVARGVTDVLGLATNERTLQRWEERRTNEDALDLYMQGRFGRVAGPRGDLLEAASYYELAIEADSTFAPAWVALAETFSALPRFTRFPPAQVRRDGAAAARTALRLAPDAASGHAALGEILYLYERDWEGARSHLERAVALDPGDAVPRTRLCELWLLTGRLEAAGEACEAARQRDPLAFRPAWLAADLHRAAGESAPALAILDSLAAAYPDFEPLAADRALLRIAAGDTSRVTRDLRGWFELLGSEALADSLATTLGAAAVSGAGGTAGAALDRVGAELAPAPADLAALAILVGSRERAEVLAAAALAERSPGSLRFGVLPLFAPLRESEEVRRRLSEAGLPPGG